MLQSVTLQTYHLTTVSNYHHLPTSTTPWSSHWHHPPEEEGEDTELNNIHITKTYKLKIPTAMNIQVWGTREQRRLDTQPYCKVHKTWLTRLLPHQMLPFHHHHQLNLITFVFSKNLSAPFQLLLHRYCCPSQSHPQSRTFTTTY